MYETWVKPNRRAIMFGCLPPLLLTTIGILIAYTNQSSTSNAWRWFGYLLIGVGLLMIGVLLSQLRHPRVGFQDGMVLFYLRAGSPIAVPVAIVEAFIFGQGPAHLPASGKQPQTINLIARLSQQHTEWATQNVRSSLGKWAEGYVTIRGTWCEPFSSEMIRTLNRRLKEVKDVAKVVKNS